MVRLTEHRIDRISRVLVGNYLFEGMNQVHVSRPAVGYCA